MNDLEMLSGYEHSIAMENGEERVKNAGLSKYLDII